MKNTEIFRTLKAKLRRFLRMDTSLPANASPASVATLKQHPLLRNPLKFGLKVLNRYPKFGLRIRRAIARFPIFREYFRRVKREVQWADILNQTDFQSVPMSPSFENKDIAPGEFRHATTPKRCIYYWIDHTVQFQSSTGVQRVIRCLAAGLMEMNTEICFVCWDNQKKALIKAARSDLMRLSCFNGPRFSQEFLAAYTDTSVSSRLLHEQISPEQLSGAWLLVPELTRITFHDSPPTLSVIDYAKTFGMKTAFIFYDAIPLKLKEYAADAKDHAEYMKFLGLADLVLPISQFAAEDLVGFLTHQLYFQPGTLPMIKPVLLPGEICGKLRITEGHNSEEALIILTVGTVEPRKNQLNLLEAFQRLCERFPEEPLKLILVGEVPKEFAPIFYEAIRHCPKVEYLEYVDDKKLASLYETCVFTVFPSVEEGFGLPIVESIWNGKPVICANFGSMAEIAQGGGCLAVDTRSVGELEKAMERLLFDKEVRKRLTAQAVSQPASSWQNYGREILAAFRGIDNPIRRIKKIYYWVDHTCNYPANAGNHRVVRGLARALQSTGVPLIPVKWDRASSSFYQPTDKEIAHFTARNGPEPTGLTSFTMSEAEPGSWLLIPELITYNGGPDLGDVIAVAKSRGLCTAIIFYDALSYKLSRPYSPEAEVAHTAYMKQLMDCDCVLPISNSSAADLQAFLYQYADRLVNIDRKLNPVVLPGEFLEHQRVTAYREPEASPIRILCVCTLEPRKNHLALLESFDRLTCEESMDAELILVGHCPCSVLEEKVRVFLERNPRIHWLGHIDDATLGLEYSRCHFTVYPSLDEGFGLPVLESLWYGRPCICRNTGAFAETAEGGGCWTVDTSDPGELAQAMLRLITDEELRTRLGAEAVGRRLRTWNEYGKDILNLLARQTRNQVLESTVNPAPWPSQAKENSPLLSICITTYNRARWLELGLKLLMRWTEPYRDVIEVVVCDNASADNTRKVAEPYLKKKNFRYYCNPENVGMLGNLKVTANLAQGKYVWILGDDDMIKEGAVETILAAIKAYPDLSLIYLNYAYTLTDDADQVTNLGQFLRESTPITPQTADQYTKIKDIATNSENFFTGIYCLILRRDHALKLYLQNISGRPFSTMLTCIPTSYYICNYMFEEMGLWIGQPAVVVNRNVSWSKYASLFLLERFPELYDLVEAKGVVRDAVDRWRTHSFPGILHYLNEIYHNDMEDNLPYFNIDRLIQRCKHLPIFREHLQHFLDIYSVAYAAGKTMNSVSPETLKQRYNLSVNG